MIQIKSLSYSVSNKTILDKVNLSFPDNKITCILGPNGAGKSSLVKCLLKLNSTFEGFISIDDHDLTQLSHLQIAQKLAYIPQNIETLSSFSVEEFIQQASYSGQKPSLELKDLYTLCDITSVRTQNLNTLSGGELKRVLFASALYQGSPYLIIDELTAGMDPGHQDSFCELIKKSQSELSKTIIWVTHNINFALHYSDHVLLLKEGQLYFDGAPEDLRDAQTFNKLYEKEFKILTDNNNQTYIL